MMGRPVVLGLLALTATAAAFGGEPPETWILSGQSNACGRGALPALAENPLVEAFDAQAGKWVPAKDPLPGMGTDRLGPWHAAALEVAAKTGKPLRLTGFASGGQPISYFKSTAPGGKALLKSVKANGQGAGVFLWYQGETDACNKLDPAKYGEELKTLDAAVRAEAGNPKMTALIVQLAYWNAPSRPADFMAIREAQRRFAVADGNALLVPALGRKAGDYVHLHRDGYLELGKEIGRALLRTRYGAKDVDWPGPVLDAAALSADGKSVVTHFAEAKKLAGAEAADFGIVDSGGAAHAVRAAAATAELSGATLVTLTFAEPVKLPAALVYGAGDKPKAGLVDEAGNRAPAVQVEIIQGAAPADKESAAPNGAGPAGAPGAAAPDAQRLAFLERNLDHFKPGEDMAAVRRGLELEGLTPRPHENQPPDTARDDYFFEGFVLIVEHGPALFDKDEKPGTDVLRRALLVRDGLSSAQRREAYAKAWHEYVRAHTTPEAPQP
jgi:hypothetical protein